MVFDTLARPGWGVKSTRKVGTALERGQEASRGHLAIQAVMNEAAEQAVAIDSKIVNHINRTDPRMVESLQIERLAGDADPGFVHLNNAVDDFIANQNVIMRTRLSDYDVSSIAVARLGVGGAAQRGQGFPILEAASLQKAIHIAEPFEVAASVNIADQASDIAWQLRDTDIGVGTHINMGMGQFIPRSADDLLFSFRDPTTVVTIDGPFKQLDIAAAKWPIRESRNSPMGSILTQGEFVVKSIDKVENGHTIIHLEQLSTFSPPKTPPKPKTPKTGPPVKPKTGGATPVEKLENELKRINDDLFKRLAGKEGPDVPKLDDIDKLEVDKVLSGIEVEKALGSEKAMDITLFDVRQFDPDQITGAMRKFAGKLGGPGLLGFPRRTKLGLEDFLDDISKLMEIVTKTNKLNVSKKTPLELNSLGNKTLNADDISRILDYVQGGLWDAQPDPTGATGVKGNWPVDLIEHIQAMSRKFGWLK